MSYTEAGRRCALCGHAQTPRRGGLAGFAAKITVMKTSGAKLVLPESRYLHVKCLSAYQKTLKKG